MYKNATERFELRAHILKALAHPTRLFLIDELSRERRCVCDLTNLVGADMSTVSKHLSILKNAGIIRDEKDGARVYYSLRRPCVMNFFDCVERVIVDNLNEQHRLIGKYTTE
jgi:ArsR family transcriptional regulator